MKNVILRMKIENILEDLMIRTASDNVIVDSGTSETLATRLATIAAKLSELESGGGTPGTGAVTEERVQTIVNEAIDALIGTAPRYLRYSSGNCCLH